MSLPLLIRIAYEPNFRTKYIGRYADGQFYGDIHGTDVDGLGEITVMLHLFDHVGSHVRSDIRSRTDLVEAEAVLGSMLAELPDLAFGDIAVRLFEFEENGVRFGLVDMSIEERGTSAELYPQGMGFFEPFDGTYST